MGGEAFHASVSVVLCLVSVRIRRSALVSSRRSLISVIFSITLPLTLRVVILSLFGPSYKSWGPVVFPPQSTLGGGDNGLVGVSPVGFTGVIGCAFLSILLFSESLAWLVGFCVAALGCEMFSCICVKMLLLLNSFLVLCSGALSVIVALWWLRLLTVELCALER